jgi:hypothetical protein
MCSGSVGQFDGEWISDSLAGQDRSGFEPSGETRSKEVTAQNLLTEPARITDGLSTSTCMRIRVGSIVMSPIVHFNIFSRLHHG